ncbi:MAG: hypothetical protein N3A55_11040 [Methylohalobius sp.]|nr:hypothetical protein [Methylohalobius sp.]
MHPSWQAFIRDRIQNPKPTRTPVVLCPLPVTLLRIQGQDAEAFLQGQVTCDLRRITLVSASMGALCNLQGRVIANFWLMRDKDGFLLLLAADLADKVVQHLRKYVLRSKVSVQPIDWVAFGVSLNSANSLPGMAKWPQSSGALTYSQGLLWLKMPPPGERLLALGEVETAQAVWLRLAETVDATAAPASHWQLADIRAGLATVTLATAEEFLPQMLDLDKLGAVAFDKGCYLGQEVIARTQYLGQIKRRLCRFQLASPRTPDPGTKLIAADETVGHVINAAPADAGQEILAVVRCDPVPSQNIRLAGEETTTLAFLSLAYTSNASNQT